MKRWPEVGDWAPIVRDRLGLRLVQHSLDLVADGSDNAAADGVAAAARAEGLELHSTFTGLAAYSDNLLLGTNAAGRQAAATWFSWAISWTAAVGGVATGGHVGAFSVPAWNDPVLRDALWRDLQTSLMGLAGEARRAGLEYLMVENLAAAREPSTMSMIRELLSNGDDRSVPVRLCLDLGHMCSPEASGEDRDPYAWLRAFGASAPVVQLQQSDAHGDHHWPFTDARNAVGRIDADQVLDVLEASGAQDTALILEIIPPFEQDDTAVLDDLAASADYWGEALVRRGFSP